MDRLSQLRDKAEGSQDSSLSTTSPSSEAYITADSSKYYSLSEVDSTLETSTIKDDISSIKDVSLASTTTESEGTMTNAEELISNLSPIGKKDDLLASYKISTQIDAANILSGGVAIFDDNDNSYDGDELVIDDNVESDEKSEVKQTETFQFKADHNIENNIISEDVDIASKDTEVVLQIDGINVDAIAIGNGLYLYRKVGQEELAAVQILDDDEQPSFKFLKVRENAEGNLEVYEEIEIEVPKEVPAKDSKMADKDTLHVPIKDINKVISEPTCTKIAERKSRPKESVKVTEVEIENKEALPDSKSEVNLNGKMVKYNETRKSPVIGSFTPMTYHSTPNKEGRPLTKTMVDQQLHTNRHSDISNVKKTIEVHTDITKVKPTESNKSKDIDDNKINETSIIEMKIIAVDPSNKDIFSLKKKDQEVVDLEEHSNITDDDAKSSTLNHIAEPNNAIRQDMIEQNKNIQSQLTDVIDVTDKIVTKDKIEINLQMKDEHLITSEHQLKNKSQNVKTENTKNINNEKTNDDIVLIESIEQKNENKVQTENTENNTVENVAAGDQYEKIADLENIVVSNEGKKVDLKVVDDNNERRSELAMKSHHENVSKVHIELNKKDKCKNISMEIDSKTFTTPALCEETNKAQMQDNALTLIKDCLSIEAQTNEPVIIDDDDDIVEVIVDSKERSETDMQDINSNEPELDSDIKDTVMPLENVSTFLKNNVKPEDDSTENKDVKMCKEAQMSNILNQLELKKYPISIPSLTEPGDDKIDNINVKKTDIDSKCSSSEKEPGNETVLKSIDVQEKNTEVNMLQKDTVKLCASIPKTEFLIITDKKQTKKPIESLEIQSESTKHVFPVRKSELASSRQQSVKSPNTENPMSSNLNVLGVKNTETPKSDSTLEISPKKEPATKTLKTDFRSIGANNLVKISIAPVSNKVKAHTETSVMKEKNIPVTNTAVIKPHTSCDVKISSKLIATEKERGIMNIEISKPHTTKINVPTKQDTCNPSKNAAQSVKYKLEFKEKKDIPKVIDAKQINNKNVAVPFGKWTEANRQEFLNKFKTKTVTSSNSNQLKNSNDLNRRDVLKKIDSQRQSNNALSKTQDVTKNMLKPEMAAFSNKANLISKENPPENNISHKNEMIDINLKSIPQKKAVKIEGVQKIQSDPSQTASITGMSRNEVCQRTGVVQNLIDKTIEGMIHRNLPSTKVQDDKKNDAAVEPSTSLARHKLQQPCQPVEQATLDEIEMQMNELHGIPFIERPPHELPQVSKPEAKSYSKVEKEKLTITNKTKIPNLLPYSTKNQLKIGQNVIDAESEDEIGEYEPITGDIDSKKKCLETTVPVKELLPSIINLQMQQEPLAADGAKKDTIITERDFDKFARRNSITYENRITVNFDGKEPNKVIQTVVENDPIPKNYTKKECLTFDPKPYKYQDIHTNNQPIQTKPVNKPAAAHDDASNRNQSKLQKAYHSVLTAKRQMATEGPITIIEDKPVKVVFMENVDFTPSQLNVQGQDLSPAKKLVLDTDVTVKTCHSLDSDILDPIDDIKSQEEIKYKTKHQRKQVLTPVVEPELELIEPNDLGIEVSPRKKRRTDEDYRDKNLKYPMRKKVYLLGSSNIAEDKEVNNDEHVKNSLNENINITDNTHNNTVSALDSLVKAAELIETQTDNNNTIAENQSSTPVKRGRGRPRKYPLTPDGTIDKSKVVKVSPQKKPRLIDSKLPKGDSTDESDSDGEIIKENWTMGKINENIVCPICNKLFRTENVVFKHVKHCTGPSPSRSDSDKRSPRRMRISQDDSRSQGDKSDDMDIDDDQPLIPRKEVPRKHTSKVCKKSNKRDEIIITSDMLIKEKRQRVETRNHRDSKKSMIPLKNNDLVCEFCGYKFRQLSYLVKHIMLRHKKVEKTDSKKADKDASVASQSVYSCEVCQKCFRKLHHLVQHRIIHNPSSAPAKISAKTSSEAIEHKIDKELIPSKQGEDLSAGFRCEPCDKSFRKLHHLVEHRETHDGINRQKYMPVCKEEKPVEKAIMPHQCDICKKSFRKLKHLNEHKEQHLETSSEKSDDKSVKSSLSTRDIIHECSLCYMVFPNEHSLNKHTIICQRKKRQSKQQKSTEEVEGSDEVAETPLSDKHIEHIESSKNLLEDFIGGEEKQVIIDDAEIIKTIPLVEEPQMSKETLEEPFKVEGKEELSQKLEEIPVQQGSTHKDLLSIKSAEVEETSEKTKKVEEKEVFEKQKILKKIIPIKENTATASKRFKTSGPHKQPTESKQALESSDDDEIRYMLNPNFKTEDLTEEKIFMKIKAKKRNSLQIEQPYSKELVKRRTSLQHPPKIPRLKPKPVEPIVSVATIRKEVKPKVETVPSTDSDDSDTTKYSFPVTISAKSTKQEQNRTPKDSQRKSQNKRKSLTGIAKRKSLGQCVTAKHKASSPLRQIKKRTLGVEYRCDCGQLFSSAALLSRHTTLAHTPPRIRRKRSPPPDDKPPIKLPPNKSISTGQKPKQTSLPRKLSASSGSSANPKPIKTVVKSVKKTSEKVSKSLCDTKKINLDYPDPHSSVKPRRAGAHRGVPVPDKMRKLMQKKK